MESAHPDLGKLGVFWHTPGSGKSYSMAFFAEKVRRRISTKFTFLLMTDRNDLDSQIYRTFVGCGAADKQTPRASTGEELKRLLKENHRYIFSLIHKFNQDVDPHEPYSTRDDIIVISDEAHRTQAGKLACNMRLALPNAAFIGTPLFKHDNLTRRIFGTYVSRYDFKRAEEDGATVKLVYENHGEKLGIERFKSYGEAESGFIVLSAHALSRLLVRVREPLIKEERAQKPSVRVISTTDFGWRLNS